MTLGQVAADSNSEDPTFFTSKHGYAPHPIPYSTSHQTFAKMAVQPVTTISVYAPLALCIIVQIVAVLPPAHLAKLHITDS